MKKGGLVGLVIFGLIWTMFVGAFDGFILYNQYRQLRATRFPQTTGTVTHSEVTRHRGSKGGTTYGVRIEYTYTVNGVRFDGDRYRYGVGSSSDSQWAHEAVRNHPADSAVTVYYNPANPGDAVLRPGTDGADLFLFLFLTPFNMVMLGLWAGAFSALRSKFRQPVAGGVKWSDDGRRIRVRLPRYSPLVSCLAVIGIGSFISIFVVGISTGFHPSMRAILAVWVILLGAGIAVAAWQRAKESRGNADLVIDQVERTVELPATFNRKQRQIVSCSAISGISLETIEHRGSKGGRSYTYAVTLQHGGSREKLTDWYDQQRAENLAAWLRERIPTGEPDAPPRKTKSGEPTADSNKA
jgi:hypothetical protein